MFRIAVCDDEKFERDRMRDLIVQFSVKQDMDIEADYFASGDELLHSYEKGKYSIISDRLTG